MHVYQANDSPNSAGRESCRRSKARRVREYAAVWYSTTAESITDFNAVSIYGVSTKPNAYRGYYRRDRRLVRL